MTDFNLITYMNEELRRTPTDACQQRRYRRLEH